MIVIWCAVYCFTKDNKKLIYDSYIHNERKDVSVFLLTYERLRKYEGKWHLESADMFPEYLFLETEGAVEKEILREDLLIIKDSDEQFLRKLFGENKCLEMSRGVIRNGVTCVTEGPLQGMEAMITKINRHKRLARVKLPSVEMLGPVYAGLEIVEKTG